MLCTILVTGKGIFQLNNSNMHIKYVQTFGLKAHFVSISPPKRVQPTNSKCWNLDAGVAAQSILVYEI